MDEFSSVINPFIAGIGAYYLIHIIAKSNIQFKDSDLTGIISKFKLEAFVPLVVVIVNLVAVNYENSCEKYEKLSNELVPLIQKITNDELYSLDIPNHCYVKRDGSPIIFTNNEILNVYHMHRGNRSLLAFKIIPLIENDRNISTAYNSFTDALISYEKNCSTNENFKAESMYGDASVINLKSDSLINALGHSIASCY